MSDRNTRAAAVALILGLGLTAVLPTIAQADDAAGPLKIYNGGQPLSLIEVFGSYNTTQVVSTPGFGFDDSNSLPRARFGGGGFEIESSARPFYNNPSPVWSNFVVGAAGEVEFRGLRSAQSLDFPGGFIQQTVSNPVQFGQYIGVGEVIYLSDRTAILPHVRVGAVEGMLNYTSFSGFGGPVNYAHGSSFAGGWGAGFGVDMKTKGLPGLQLLWLHKEFCPMSLGVTRQTWTENELRVGLLFSFEHLAEFFGSAH
jgi:hypothetical protein